MHLTEILQSLTKYGEQPAIIWHDKSFSYSWLLNRVDAWRKELSAQQIKSGDIVEIDGDYTPTTIALLLALVDLGCITVPLSPQSRNRAELFREIAQIETVITVNDNEEVSYTSLKHQVNHPILLQLKSTDHPGLILFSSGSTGQPKAAVHDWLLLLDRYKKPAAARRVIVFLLFDHIGGVNTLLHTLFNGGSVIIVKERTAQAVCEAIANHRVQVLPTSPTFLNLILISHEYEKYDLSSLELITYGTEVMPEVTLKKFHELFPTVRLLQTYGLSEIGILKTKSKSSDSLYMKVESEGSTVRVRDGLLEIKTKTAMLGYLNAESPFTNDGWFKTGDMVEVDGDYIHILGRASEIINVGGMKIFPAQVENVIQQMDNVDDALVTGEPSPITGQIVKATVKLKKPESPADFRKRMIAFCKGKLENFAVPQKVIFVNEMAYGDRFKKMHKTVAK